MPRPEIDWKVSVGQIITAIFLLLGLAVTWGSTSAKLDSHATTITAIQSSLDALEKSVEVIHAEQAAVKAALDQRNIDEGRR